MFPNANTYINFIRIRAFYSGAVYPAYPSSTTGLWFREADETGFLYIEIESYKLTIFEYCLL